MKGRVEFTVDRCKGCEICSSVCPRSILCIDEDNTNNKGYHPMKCFKEEDCIGCGNCATMCPDGAIAVYREEEKE